uniref:E3 ubiquitin-protein ligase RNF13-like n=1 Tax=Crassostrea virginica TaxID=6565 RepID=A0A8B8BBJ1_CRAVI|nr:E3 ubiquitin-protein ligase RNF13-like [Crassostrea virginica]
MAFRRIEFYGGLRRNSILIVFAVGVVVRVAGDNQSDTDIIVTFSVLGFCLVLLMITVAIYLRSRENRTPKERKGVGISILDQGKLGMKMRPVHKEFASDCAICLLPKESKSHTIVQISCKHNYHKKCIKECFKKMKSTQCPECRQEAEDFPAVATVHNENE